MSDAVGRGYYDSNYPDYEKQTSPRKLRFYMTLVRRWVPAGARVFELGVGMGHFLREASAEYECEGCDVNEFAAASARTKAPKAVVHRGSVECIPEARPPAAVVCWDVLEHIADVEGALSHVASKVAPGGFLIGAVPVYDGPLGRLVRRLDRDPTHVWKLSRREWLAVLERHGFDVEEWGGIVRRLLFRRCYLHVTRPQWLLRRIGGAIYFVSRKKDGRRLPPGQALR